MEVRYVPWGIANNFGTYIELNEHLPAYPELHKAILDHELAHTNNPGFTKKDLALDLGPSKVNYLKLFKFMCIYPKTFLQFAPFYKKGNVLVYDINMIISWSAFIVLIAVSIYLSIIL